MLWRVFWLGLFTAAAVYIFNFLTAMDINKKAYNQRPGACRKLKGIEYGSEDFAVIESLGLVFITSGMWFLNPRPAEAKGRIFLFDFNRTDDPIELELVGLPSPEKFRPHGISHWQEGETIFIYVISHQPPDFTHTVEVFQYETGEKLLLKYVKTLEDKKPNTLVAVGKDQFIMANDGTAQTQLKMLFEFLLGKKTGSICYFDGKESHWLAEELSSTTAVATDRYRKHLLVGQVNEKAMSVFALSDDLKSMKKVSRLELKTAPDNFYVDEENVVWIGSHPVVGQLFTHVGQADELKSYAPSQVLRVAYTNDWKSAEIHQVFMDDGRLISASSVAAFSHGKLLIGTTAFSPQFYSISRASVYSSLRDLPEMRTNLIYVLLLLGASACYAAGAVVEYVDLLGHMNRAMEDVEKPETESNSTTTTPTENPMNCSCETIFYDAEQEEGYIKMHPRLQGCEPAECHYKIAPANDSILTMSLLHGYLTEMSVYYYSDTHNDIIVYNNKRGNQNPYHAPENYGFFITIRRSAMYEYDVYKFRRYKKSDLKHFCPEPYVKVNSTVQSLQTVSWPWSGCALRFEKKPDQHPMQLLTSCKQFGLYAEANLPNNSSVYKVQDGTQTIEVMNLPNSSDVSFVSLYYWNTILMDCEIKYMALEYDPCNCSTTSFNLTVDKQMRLTSPGYPDMMCAKIECQYKFEVSEAAPKGMKHAFFVEAVHKTKVRGDSLLFKVDNNKTVDNLNEHQKNISETAIYLGEHLDIAYSASSLFSNDHGFELKVMVINMPDDCHCPTHKTMELASSETFSFSVQPHCPMMRCRFKIPNTELGNDRIFRLHVDYHLPHAREGIVVEGGEVVHSLYGEEETLVMHDLHDTVDFVTNTTVNIAYYRERSEGNFTANDVSNFTLKWNWVTKNECACHSTGPLMALDTSNVLYSPRYPQEYCSNSHCEYRIQAQEGYHVRLNVSFFETEPHSDFVYVFDGENKIPIFRQSGHLKSIPTLETKTRKATVLFTSDASNTDKGFMIQYQAVPDQVVPLGQESSGAYLVVTIVVIILLLLTGALFLLYKKFVKKYLVLQSVENPVFSFSAKQDVVVVLDKE